MPKSLEINDSLIIPAGELRFRFSRSSGPGGQHVNKVETKADLIFNIASCTVLTEEQKQRLRKLGASKVDADDNLVLSSQSDRSRSGNIAAVEQQLVVLIRRSLVEPKKRTATRASASSKVARRRSKQRQSERKTTRTKIQPRGNFEDEDF